jgi:hypothetical protein
MRIKSPRETLSALTVVELVVILVVAWVAAALVLPIFEARRTHYIGEQTHALSNAKQIALAMRLYADDHNGNFPSYTLRDGKPTTTPVPDSNTAFAQLFPTYINYETIFWVSQSPFCAPTPPDGIFDKKPLDTPVETLKRGENAWACVLGLNSNSDASFPFIVSGFANPARHTYSTETTFKSAAGKSLQVILVHPDGSGVVVRVDPASMGITGYNGSGAATGDIFTTANSANGWLTPANTVVNPK